MQFFIMRIQWRGEVSFEIVSVAIVKFKDCHHKTVEKRREIFPLTIQQSFHKKGKHLKVHDKSTASHKAAITQT